MAFSSRSLGISDIFKPVFSCVGISAARLSRSTASTCRMGVKVSFVPGISTWVGRIIFICSSDNFLSLIHI